MSVSLSSLQERGKIALSIALLMAWPEKSAVPLVLNLASVALDVLEAV